MAGAGTSRKDHVVYTIRFSGWAAVAALALSVAPGGAALAQAPVKGGTLIYLEQQPHTNLYPPAGGF